MYITTTHPSTFYTASTVHKHRLWCGHPSDYVKFLCWWIWHVRPHCALRLYPVWCHCCLLSPSFAFANFGVCQGKSIWRVCVVQSMLCIWVYSKFLHGENLRIYVVVLFGTISILALGYISSSWSCSHSPFPNQTNVVYSWIWLQRFHALESGLKAQKQGRNRLICWLIRLSDYFDYLLLLLFWVQNILHSRSQIEGRNRGNYARSVSSSGTRWHYTVTKSGHPHIV